MYNNEDIKLHFLDTSVINTKSLVMPGEWSFIKGQGKIIIGN